MKDYLSEIDNRFPVRNSAAQKAAFREYALSEAQANSVSSGRQEDNNGHVNLIFGDPNTARVIFTAHYDTPRRGLLPNLMLVTNPFLRWTYRIGAILLMLLPAVGAAFAVFFGFRLNWAQPSDRLITILVYHAVYFVMLFLFFRGPANKRNRNDNTSGTAAVMELLETVGTRSDCAFILFDDEEKGLKGSKAYAAAHPDVKQNPLIVNFDCVGNGDRFIFSPSEAASGDPLYLSFKDALTENETVDAFFYPRRKARMNSDHKSFVRSVGVCACRYRRLIGCYTGRIHTPMDTVADPKTVSDLVRAVSDCIKCRKSA
ncbi:MAG: M28 family peptidase [Clostridia bacterium]|nr:M28 family peptidase [Clostridia bacterium]